MRIKSAICSGHPMAFLSQVGFVMTATALALSSPGCASRAPLADSANTAGEKASRGAPERPTDLVADAPSEAIVAIRTGASMQGAREASARSIGRAVAAQIEEARSSRSPADLESLLGAEIGVGGVAALGVYDERGVATHRVGDLRAKEALPKTVA